MDRDTVEPQVTSFPGENAQRWVEYHHQHAAPSTYVYEFVWDITRESIGPFCKDVDGNILMDFTAHVAASPLGYNNPKMTNQLKELFDIGPVDPSKIAGQDFYVGTSTKRPEDSSIPGPSHLMDALTDITSHYSMDTVFLSNTGAEAVENALKICYDKTEGKYGITFDGAFHGRTLGALSVNRSRGKYRRSFPELHGIESLPFCQEQQCSQENCNCGFFPTEDESLLSRVVDGSMNADEIAYIIIEPIQGEGGYKMPSKEFMNELESVSSLHDIPIIADEVQTGIGRTGEWWGCDNYAIEPDVISTAKPARVGATIANKEMFPEKKGRLSSTWGAGDVIATAQGVATIRAIDEYNLLQNAIDRGAQFVDLCTDMELDTVENVRNKGLLIGIELTSTEDRDSLIDAALQQGLLLMGCGDNTIRVLPPLDVTEREIQLSVELLESAAKNL